MAVKKDRPPVPKDDDLQVLAVLRLHWKKIFFISAAVILAIWGLAVVGDYALNYGGQRVTELAWPTEHDLTLTAEVTIVRDEVLLPEMAAGTLVPLVESGERVAAEQEYAVLCSDTAQAEAFVRQRALTQRLSWLKESGEAVNYHAVNVEQLGREVDLTFARLLDQIDGGGYARIGAAREEYLQRATTLAAALGGQMNLSAEIAAVEGELAALRLQLLPERIESLRSADSGYFVAQTDGLEDILTPESIQNITPEAWPGLRDREASSADAPGKLIRSFTWYVVAILPAEQAQQLQTGKSCGVYFPQESARRFTMKVESIRRGGGGKEAAVVFSCSEKEDSLLRLRRARASIVLGSYKGLAIPTAALRKAEKGEGTQKRTVTGVYIARGSQYLLREVDVLYQTKTTAIVAWGDVDEARAVDGDRVTIRGRITSLTQPEAGQLLLIGQELSLTAEDTQAQSATGEKTVLTTRQTRIFDEVLISAKDMEWERQGDDLIIDGSGFVYQERRGTGLRIYDAVLTAGRLPDGT
ncbi:MAG: hypothetical protein FWH26_07805 [Oscillospiraceae bacterium]|nr:hypothetical protein [Oscillospiraceae bacterium]